MSGQSGRRGEGSGKGTRVKGRAGNEKQDSLPATGGKDLGKLKGVAIDYLTGQRPWSRFRSRCGPGPRWACARRPLAELSADKLTARYTNKSEGQWTFLNVHHTHARTHACTWSLHAFVRARSPSLSPSVLPFFFIFIAERDTDGVVDKISALAKRRRVYFSRWKSE